MIEINWRPTTRQLRQFAAISILAIPLVTAIWTSCNIPATVWATGVGVFIGTLGWIWPRAIQPVFIGLTLVTAPIGMVIGEIAMLLIYILLFVPLAVVFRLRGRDHLNLTRRTQASYWTDKSKPSSAARYYNQW